MDASGPIHPVDAKAMSSPPKSQAESVYHVYMAGLAMLAIVVSVGLIFSPTEPDVVGVLTVVDFILCLFFIYDFLRHLWYAPSKWRYMVTWGWLDLLSSVPFLVQARWTRLARVARFLMLARAFRVLWESARIEKRSIIMAGATFAIQSMFIVICIIVLHVEHGAPNANINSASDVLWWAISTVTTVGYGDVFPVTNAGRICGAILMVSGIGYLATVLGFVAQSFLPVPKSHHHHTDHDPRG